MMMKKLIDAEIILETTIRDREMDTEYHVLESRNRCSETNEVEVVDNTDGYTSEAKTECLTCGFKDYWAYGFFESSQERESNCKKYVNQQQGIDDGTDKI